jgi:hypothetical protein
MGSGNSNDLIFKYEAFGLKIHSEIQLADLTPLKSETTDLSIYLDTVDLPIGTVLHEGESYIVQEKAIYRFWDEIGKFKITTDSIIIDPSYGVDRSILITFLMGTVFATFLRLRGSFVLHASSVNIADSAVAFSGFKGYGKSTTAMAFYNEGYSVVADDFIAVEFDNNNNPFIFPGFPSLRLSSKSRKAMGLNFDKINLQKNIIDKTYQSVPKLFSKNKLTFKKIYILKRSEESKIIDLKPPEAFMELVKNTFGIHMFSRLELPDNFFQCEQLVKKVDVSILEVSDSIGKMIDVVKLVEEDMVERL